MEWLGEIEEGDIPPDDDFFAVASDGITRKEKPLNGRLYMVFSNQQALQQMFSLWEMWRQDRTLPRGLGKWNQLFGHLKSVRTWNVNDRLVETGVLEDWNERITQNQEVIPCEIELWFRKSFRQREVARDRIVALITALQGEVLYESMVEDISYHAILARLPISAIRIISSEGGRDTSLVQCEQIQFFRATGQMNVVCPTDAPPEEVTERTVADGGLREPVVALFDGLPLQNHNCLVGRLIIDDPDDFEARYEAAERQHGTAMASLIIHGDLNDNAVPLNRRLYVRPILSPDQRDWRSSTREETAPENILTIDLIHRAVRRLFDGENDLPAVAPQICVINLSIGIRDRPFNSQLSPLARLLDWLSWKYGVLFVVSAGNYPHDIEIGIPRGQLAQLPPDRIQQQILSSIAADARNRRLLSPAEAVNVLTIGSVHHDVSPNRTVRAIQPYVDTGLPSIINAQGLGFRRAIKPDIFLPGGKIAVSESFRQTPNIQFQVYNGALPPGQRVASPGTAQGVVNGSRHTRGTSNATALASRTASILYDVLEELRDGLSAAIIDSVPRALWLKTMIVHAASWGNARPILEQALRTPQNSRKFSEYITRLIGYGAIDAERVMGCQPFRVTALGAGFLSNDQAHIHRMPLPQSINGKRVWRRLIITLTWISPVNASHQDWRRAHIWFSPSEQTIGVSRQEADSKAVQRGTVQHEILEGNDASVFMDNESLEINVSCRSDAGALEESVPYTIAVTLEVAPEIGIDIYNEVRVRVQQTRIDITPQA